MRTDASRAPILLVMAPDEGHVFDLYLREVLLTEGYSCFDEEVSPERLGPADLAPYALVVVSCGAASRVSRETVEAYVSGGGLAIVLRPPPDWCAMLGLSAPGPTYAIARDAYLHLDTSHRWLAGFPAADLQVPGEADVCPTVSAEGLAFVAGQIGLPSPFPAVLQHRIGHGMVVAFTYDLAACIVAFHQGRPEAASDGPDPDANRDGKFTADDLFEGTRDFRLRHVPQADLHQDLLVRAIRGLTADVLPLPRLWHFPRSAPAVLFVNGDGDAMNWEDLTWTVDTCAAYGARFTFYLMDAEIEAFAPADVAAVRARGHAFGPHPWAGFRPTVAEWAEEVRGIVSRFETKFGSAPRSLRSHCVIFPGWDETPRLFAEVGLRLDTSFLSGYRFQSGFLNGSALPAKFADRSGAIIDCYEQCTIHGDDVLASTKALLPPLSEEECMALSRQVMRDCATLYHGVYHPYFHPIYLGGRGGLPTRRWSVEVLATARKLGLLSVSADEWLAFNDARRSVRIGALSWRPDSGELRFTIRAGEAIDGLTVLLPPCAGRRPAGASLDGTPCDLRRLPYEGLGWTALEVGLAAGQECTLAVAYGRRDNQ